MKGCFFAVSRDAAIASLIVCVVVVCTFGDALLGGSVFAFRDAAHTFPPLYRLVSDEWLAGRAPLWNPLLNGGQPLAGSGVAGAFYPPQILLAAVLPDGTSLVSLVLLHLLLTGIAAGLIARDNGCSLPAATLAGLTCAGCGAVLLQVYNPIMAAGAAWFAWSMRAGLQLIRRRTVADMLVLACSLALAVLAGDPQAAYHAGLVLGIFLLWGILRRPAGARAVGLSTAATTGAALVAAASLAAALSFVQISESAAFLRTTTRFADAYPLSIWDVRHQRNEASPPTDAPGRGSTWYDVILGRPPESVSFYHEIYRFSVMPWQLVETLSPTLCGTLLRRWTLNAGFERDAWVATLYAGMLPLACVVMTMWRLHDPRAACWKILLIVAFAACLGGFGIAGLLRHVVARGVGGPAPVPYRPGDEVGGLYWALVTFLPGYAGFRYPAKWLTPWALAFAQLAALGFDAFAHGIDRTRIARCLAALAVVSLFFTAVALAFASGSDLWLILAGGGLACLAAGVAALASIRMSVKDRYVAWLLVGLAALDLVAAGRLNVSLCRLSAIADGAGAVRSLSATRLPACRETGGRPRLAAIDGLMPDPDPARPAAWARSVGTIMRGNIPLLAGWGKFGEPGTAMEADTELLTSPLDPDRLTGFARRMFDTSAVEFFVLPGDASGQTLPEWQRDWSDQQRTGELRGTMPEGAPMPAFAVDGSANCHGDSDVRFVRNESALPRVRITRSVRRIAPIPTLPRSRHVAGLATIAFPNPSVPWLGDTALVESAADLPAIDTPNAGDGQGGDLAGESCRIIVDEPRQVVIEATLAAPGLVVLADSFHPDWRLQVASDHAPPADRAILRVNRIHRGCLLPAGQHVLEYRHRSRRFEQAAMISGTAWIAVAAGAIGMGIRGRRR